MKIGTSQNGWTVYDDTTHYVRTAVEGVKFWSANADAATVLDDFTQRFHDTIEPITLPVKESPGYDDWSYAVRPIRGQTTGYSNHGSATARDLNATRHPRGVHNTYTRAKRAALKALVDSYDGVLRHGEFYTSTIDGMHVEINASPAAVKREADRIRAAKTATTKPPTKPAPEKETDVPITPTDATILWNTTNNITGQTPAGSLHEIDLRTEAANLRDRAKDGVAAALADPAHPLTVWLTRLEDKLDALAKPGDPPAGNAP